MIARQRVWPLLAYRMVHTANSADGDADRRARLSTLIDSPVWRQGPVSEVSGRLVAATLAALTSPPADGTPVTGPRVFLTAAPRPLHHHDHGAEVGSGSGRAGRAHALPAVRTCPMTAIRPVTARRAWS
ncbi:hypothetical protein ACIRJR_13775 [Streptomyces sp. NPDC102402]|uniref:hypothetical protein n=1 Tax=Streptomyces sp. NPDC102402 TaxID=3366169 RepID=UPI003812B1C3